GRGPMQSELYRFSAKLDQRRHRSRFRTPLPLSFRRSRRLRVLGPIEVAVLLVDGQCAEVASVAGRKPLRLLDPSDEPCRGSTKLQLGISIQAAGDVHRCEEKVAQLVGLPPVGRELGRGLRPARQLNPELGQLVVEVRESARDVRVLEPDEGGAPLRLARQEESRKVLGDVVKDPLALLLGPLQVLPAVLYLARAHRRGRVPEDVRVPPYELVVNPPSDRFEICATLLLQEQSEEEN